MAHRVGYRIGFKETDSHRLLPRDSSHAAHVHRGVVYSQILRWATRSSSYQDFIDTCNIVFPSWRLQGITRSLIRNCVKRVFSLTNLRSNWSFGFFRCQGRSCAACPFAHTCSFFSDSRTARIFPILGHFTCETSHCIYLLFCSRCFMFYVGQTSNAVCLRIGQHLRSIAAAGPTAVSFHFNQECGHHAFRWLVLDRCFSQDRRLQKEASWIRTLRSHHPFGLNQNTGQTSHKINLVSFPALFTARLSSVIQKACRAHNIEVRFSNKSQPNLASLLR